MSCHNGRSETSYQDSEEAHLVPEFSGWRFQKAHKALLLQIHIQLLLENCEESLIYLIIIQDKLEKDKHFLTQTQGRSLLGLVATELTHVGFDQKLTVGILKVDHQLWSMQQRILKLYKKCNFSKNSESLLKENSTSGNVQD